MPTHEPETRDGVASRGPPAPQWVWRQLNAWCWESQCGRFRIERFIIGEHAGIDGFPWPDRFRVLKLTPEWWGEVAPSEASLSAAQESAEGWV